ncbi:hypothetical protein BCR34DRAFT_120944 [Clohesyomyces aquaticus]|uniref:3'-5' exonuclease domain-containing protein n=1 Tax=Clohesyomyces aquaticus TaxID=1231657 RepID=A0A1Y2A2S4_9PLEO|nr:hypothetical protein BCR34DRAFT_120944 [Clohesyomyces aquaticus]
MLLPYRLSVISVPNANRLRFWSVKRLPPLTSLPDMPPLTSLPDMLCLPRTPPAHSQASNRPLTIPSHPTPASGRQQLARNHTWNPTHGIAFSRHSCGIQTRHHSTQSEDQLARGEVPCSSLAAAARRPPSRESSGQKPTRLPSAPSLQTSSPQPASTRTDSEPSTRARRRGAPIVSKELQTINWLKGSGERGGDNKLEGLQEPGNADVEWLQRTLYEWEPLAASTTELRHEDVMEAASGEAMHQVALEDISGNKAKEDSPIPKLSPSFTSAMEEAFYSEQFNEQDEEMRSEGEQESESKAEGEPEVHIPLSFQIPEEAMLSAMKADPGTEAQFYRHDIYRGPDDKEILLHYCTTFDVAERAAKYFLNEKVLGFDIEWRPWANAKTGGVKENVSLIQLACEDRIALFHIALFKGDTPDKLLPPTLKTIIEDPEIWKVGVSIKGDFTRVDTWLGTKAQGQYELSRLHNLVEHYVLNRSKVNNKLVSLAKQVEQHLGLPLFKGKVRESDWSATTHLSREQIAYAATDAYAGFRIFDALEAKRVQLRPVPPRPVCVEPDSARPVRRRAKAAPKLVEEREEEDIVEEDEQYDTAAEELSGTQEIEQLSDGESLSECSEESIDPNGDYALPTTLIGRLSINADQDDGAVDTYVVPTRRVGRIRLPSPHGANVSYPILPDVSSEAENESDSSSAFETPPKPLKRRIARKMVQEPAPVDPDIDLDNTRSEMEVDKDEELLPSGSTTEKRPVRATEFVKQDQGSGKVLEQIKNRECTLDPTPASTKSKKAKPRPSQPEAQSTPMPEHYTPIFTPLVQTTQVKSEEYISADAWASEYLSSTIPSPSKSMVSPPPRVRATLPPLRAYHLWRHQLLPLQEIAKHLRDPPLAISTVNSYILQAIVLEKLEYKNEELRVLLKKLPEALRRSRFRYLVERVEGSGMR